MDTIESRSSGANVIDFAARTRTPPRSWRARVGDLVAQAEDVMFEVKDDLLEDTMAPHGTYARQLLGDALDLLSDNGDTLQHADPSDFYGHTILPAVAMVIGAASMEAVHSSLQSALEPAVAALEEAGRILDEADANSQ